MNNILILLTFLTKNSCLELKFLKKTEYFIKDCNSDLDAIFIEKLKNECNEEDFVRNNCQVINGES